MREMLLAQHDHIIEHLSAYTANDSLDGGILPRTPRRGSVSTACGAAPDISQPSLWPRRNSLQKPMFPRSLTLEYNSVPLGQEIHEGRLPQSGRSRCCLCVRES